MFCILCAKKYLYSNDCPRNRTAFFCSITFMAKWLNLSWLEIDRSNLKTFYADATCMTVFSLELFLYNVRTYMVHFTCVIIIVFTKCGVFKLFIFASFINVYKVIFSLKENPGYLGMQRVSSMVVKVCHQQWPHPEIGRHFGTRIERMCITSMCSCIWNL